MLLNIETSQEILDELVSAFRFNDAVLRHMIISCKEAITEPSPMMKSLEKERERDNRETRVSSNEEKTTDDTEFSPEDSDVLEESAIEAVEEV